MNKNVFVYCSFNNFNSKNFRFIEEASKLGKLNVLLYSDELIKSLTGKAPEYPIDERFYAVQALRHVKNVYRTDLQTETTLPEIDKAKPDIWVVQEKNDNHEKKEFCESNGIEYYVIASDKLEGYPAKEPEIDFDSSNKRVIVTGCYDWFHTGHIRFFEETTGYGDLYVIVGSDKNLKLLKGEGHPMFPQEERLYMVQSMRYVKSATISTGSGYMDAEPEILKIKPHIYIINEDSEGKDEKQRFCDKHDIEFVILKREPKPGLPKRISTNLRGF